MFPIAKIRRAAFEVYHRFWFWLACLLFGLLFPVRVSGTRLIPKSGGVLVLANHQSFLDPPLLGLAISRPCSYLARKTLFRFAPFRWLIASLDAIPLDQEGFAKEGLRMALDRLDRGKPLIVFPEGSRTPDGKLGQLQPGVLLLLRRARVPVVVAGIAGAFECMPIHRPFPIPSPIWIHFTRWDLPDPSVGRASLDTLRSAMQIALDEAERRHRRLSPYIWTEKARQVFLTSEG